MFHEIKPKQDLSKPRVTEFISGDSSKKEECIVTYYDKDGDSSEEKSSYAKTEVFYVNGKQTKQKCYVSYNMSDMCHPDFNRKKVGSVFKEVKQTPFLHYMDFLINKKERSYELAQKKQREQKTV